MAKEVNSLMSAKMETETKEKYRKNLDGDKYLSMFDTKPKRLIMELFTVIVFGYILYKIRIEI